MKFFSADYIFPISDNPIKNGVIQLTEDGEVVKVAVREDFPTVDIKSLKGILLPGFVNAHCHLELSHMKNLCETRLGLIEFISKVVSLRDFEEDIIQRHIAERDQEMYENGIQAVGDICNKLDTAEVKRKSKIHYYSFVEMFDLLQKEMTASAIENYRSVFRDQADNGLNKKSFVPHAPYSVSPELFHFINKANPEEKVVSIHNQETLDELRLFSENKGGFYGFYKKLGLDISDFKSQQKSSMSYILEHLEPRKKNIFVHNTFTKTSDIEKAHAWSENCYWASCPNANLYIENRLPDYRCFLDSNAKLCLGTDSIMSNWQLDIWEEVKTIKKYNSYIPLSSLFRWACLNGAEALDYDRIIGSIKPGKKPGLVHVDVKWEGESSDISGSSAKRVL
jgi:cytosine/adenosine deaminase-related metal-dependent hydrolase